MIGSRQNRKKNLKDEQGHDTRNSTRYLNFKDISPLVKSCNTFVIESNLQNQSTLDPPSLVGKISPPHLQTHSTSLIQHPYLPQTLQSREGEHYKSNFQVQLNQVAQPQHPFFQSIQTQNTFTNYATETGSTLNNPNTLTHYNLRMTQQNPLSQGMLYREQESPSQQQQLRLARDQMMMTNKLSSGMVESPPPLNDITPEKGIKDFNTQYLGQGMWPSKAG